jgi:hypothetical protein
VILPQVDSMYYEHLMIKGKAEIASAELNSKSTQNLLNNANRYRTSKNANTQRCKLKSGKKKLFAHNKLLQTDKSLKIKFKFCERYNKTTK